MRSPEFLFILPLVTSFVAYWLVGLTGPRDTNRRAKWIAFCVTGIVTLVMLPSIVSGYRDGLNYSFECYSSVEKTVDCFFGGDGESDGSKIGERLEAVVPDEQDWFANTEGPYAALATKLGDNQPMVILSCQDDHFVLTVFFDLRRSIHRQAMSDIQLQNFGGVSRADFGFILSNGVTFNIPLRVIDEENGTPFGFTSTGPGIRITSAAGVYELVNQMLKNDQSLDLLLTSRIISAGIETRGLRYLEQETKALASCL